MNWCKYSDFFSIIQVEYLLNTYLDIGKCDFITSYLHKKRKVHIFAMSIRN